MTYQSNSTLSPEILEAITEQGLEYIPELIRIIVNEAMKQEQQGHANGFKNKTIRTSVGEIKFDTPQVREGGFYPESLEKGLRSESAKPPMQLLVIWTCVKTKKQN